MSRPGRAIVETERGEEARPRRDRSRHLYWPPRPTTIIAALFVGSSLIWMVFIDRDFARNLSELYGWPFCYQFRGPNDPGPLGRFYAAALAADVAISVALVASACVTTQIAACLLVRSPRFTLRIVGFAIAVTALFLMGCRLKQGFLIELFYTGFCYGLASLIVLLACLLLRLELPRGDEPEQER